MEWWWFEITDYPETIIRNLLFELHEANFSLRSKPLVPEAGACTHCRYNSAAVTSLFPEIAKKAVCSNASCFEQKALAHYRNFFTKALEKEKPEALIINNDMDELLPRLLETARPHNRCPIDNLYRMVFYILTLPNPVAAICPWLWFYCLKIPEGWKPYIETYYDNGSNCLAAIEHRKHIKSHLSD